MIRMKINQDKASYCEECGRGWRDTGEMYTLNMFGEMYDICRACSNELFRKTLRASCMYDGKVKTKEDKIRAENEKQHRNLPR